MDTLFPDLAPSIAPGPRPTSHTVFFALLPPMDVARRARGFAEGLIRTGQMSGALRPERTLHVSLMLVGKELAEAPTSASIRSLCVRAGAVRQRPFAVSLNRLQAWGRSGAQGPVVAVGDDGTIGIEALHRNLAHGLGVAACAAFNPHMTLLYGRGSSSPVRTPPIGWTVREFVLIHSLVGLSRYEVLGCFPLSA